MTFQDQSQDKVKENFQVDSGLPETQFAKFLFFLVVHFLVCQNGFYTPQFTIVDIFVIGNFQIKAPQVPNRKICHAAKFREVVTARSCDLKKSRFYRSDLKMFPRIN